MKSNFKNFHLSELIKLCDQMAPQEMFVHEKLAIKEERESFAAKFKTLMSVRDDIIISYGGSASNPILEEHENFKACEKEIEELMKLDCVMDYNPISEKLMLTMRTKNISYSAIAIMVGKYNPEDKTNSNQ